jgi:mRNA-degrading endonuclease RelE of RelBE toxin-antitoxin system
MNYGTFILMGNERKYRVVLSKKVKKNLLKVPPKIRDKFTVLAIQLSESGPVASNWAHYSKLGDTQYHCHLAYHWVACWSHEKKTITIEVYYVGSRENAPY